MFAKNQYNEGVHAPNVDGVFLGRRTKSDIVAFEQIGRALSVRGDTTKKIEEYTKCSLEELLQIANSRGILLEKNASKEQIIELLVSPIIIDLADNIEFLEELETNLGDRVKEIRDQGPGNERIIKITDTRIDISVINKDLLLVLQKVRENLRNKTWDDWYELVKIYHEHFPNKKMPSNFRTINGYEYDKNGYNIYTWKVTQKTLFNKGKLSKERKKLLEDIGMTFETKKRDKWLETYQLAKSYFIKNGDLNIPKWFKTKNGIDLDEQGIDLFIWLQRQKSAYRTGNIKLERLKLLKEIGLPYEKKSKIENRISLCDEYKLDYENYPYLVEKLAYMELFIIIMSLQEMHMPLSENGVPNEIFFISDKQAIKKYGFGRRELINKFFGGTFRRKE